MQVVYAKELLWPMKIATTVRRPPLGGRTRLVVCKILRIHWRTSVVKYGVGVSQVKPPNCFRRLEKLALPSIFDTRLSSLMM